MIVLYDANTTEITSMGLGALPDAISCSVKEELNGSFELEMEYPITGLHFEDIQLRRLIYCKSNPFSDPQLFRIYSITKPINGVTTINAEHISYDLSGYPIEAFEADSVRDVFSYIHAHTIVPVPFNFSTTMINNTSLSVLKPKSIRNLLGGDDDSVTSVYGGEYEFDNFDVHHYNQRGTDNGIKIEYGKNLTDLEQEETCNGIYTAIYPYAYNDEEGLTELPEKIVYISGIFNYTRILPIDFSSEWNSSPTEEELRRVATEYVENHHDELAVPIVSLTVSFVDLSQSMEQEYRDMLSRVLLGDVVTVAFSRLGVDATARCVSTTYDAILDRYIEVEIGTLKTNLGDIIVDQGKKTAEILEDSIPTESFIREAAKNAAKQITGSNGGYIWIRDKNNDGTPDELLIMDNPDPNQAHNVWKFNQNGLGFSESYDSDEMAIALTSDGYIYGDRIIAGEILADKYELQDPTSPFLNVLEAIPKGIRLTSVGDTRTEEVGAITNPAAGLSGAYDFVKSGGYWVSQNAGIGNSYSYAKINFNFSIDTNVEIKCMSFGEPYWDFGIISKEDKELTKTYADDSSDIVLYTFKGNPTANFIRVPVLIHAGEHFVTIKYKKDGSADTAPDMMAFRCEATIQGQTSSIQLEYRTSDPTSSTGYAWHLGAKADLVFDGLVTFEDLAGEGTTQINGANIITGTISADVIDVSDLKVDTVYYKEHSSDNDLYFPILSAQLWNDSSHGSFDTVTYVGPRNINNGGIHDTDIYGNKIMFLKDSSTSPVQALTIDTTNHTVTDNGYDWSIGTESNPMHEIRANYLYVGDAYFTDVDTAYHNHDYYTMFKPEYGGSLHISGRSLRFSTGAEIYAYENYIRFYDDHGDFIEIYPNSILFMNDSTIEDMEDYIRFTIYDKSERENRTIDFYPDAIEFYDGSSIETFGSTLYFIDSDGDRHEIRLIN